MAPGVTTRANTGGRPKQRKLRACDSCRQRKLRCDTVPGSCRNCQAYGEVCIISRNGATVRRPARPTSTPAATNVRASKSPASPASARSGGPSPAAAIAVSSPAQTNVAAQQFSTNSAAWPRPTSSHTSSHLSAPPADAESVQGVVTTEVGVHPTNAKFAGVSSAQVLGKVAEAVSQPYAPNLNVMDFFCPTMTYAEEFPLPATTLGPLVEKQVADVCVQTYLETYHNLYPILDQNEFRLAYDTFYSGSAPSPSHIACIYLVIALGCNKRDIFDMHLHAAYDLYGRLISQPFISSVQALILMTICFLNAERDGQAILCIGLATQISMSMGLHRSLYTHRHPREFAFVLKDHNTRNCIWWACYCLEKKLSFENGRCSIIHDIDCDAELPVLSQSSTPSLTQQNQGSFTFLTSYIQLAKGLSNISQSLFSRTATHLSVNELLGLVAAADNDLLDWRTSLPEHLQPDNEHLYARRQNDAVAETGSEMLHCVYYNALVIIHRASLIFMSTQPTLLQSHPNMRMAASDSVCLGAARALIRSANRLVLEQNTFPLLRWMNPYTINGVMALFIGVLQWPLRWTCQTDLALIKSVKKCFDMSTDHQASSRFLDLLSLISKASEKAEEAANGMEKDKGQDSTVVGGDGDAANQGPHRETSIVPIPSTNTASIPVPNWPNSAPVLDQTPNHVHSNNPWLITPAPSDIFSVASGIADNDLVSGDLQFADFFGDQSSAWNMWPILQGNDPVEDGTQYADILDGHKGGPLDTSTPGNMAPAV